MTATHAFSPISLSPDVRVPLFADERPADTLLLHGISAKTRGDFLCDVQYVVQRLPELPFAFNVCEDRYLFLVAFCAAMLKGTVNLLPPGRQRTVLNQLAVDHTPSYCIVDSAIETDLPIINLRRWINEGSFRPNLPDTAKPAIPAQQIAARVFTSGSTGKPTAHEKPWGTLAGTARLLAGRFSFDLDNPAIVATVPTQHMYGLEMSAMMALQGRAVLHAAKPFYPVDVQAALASLAADRVLVTTPIHLRALVASELTLPPLARIISATAPLDPELAAAAERRFGARVQEIYGCTEAGSIATRAPTRAQHWALLPGFALHDAGPTTSVQAPHLAGSAPLHDEIAVEADGHFKLLGRHADMINVAGKRASLADLTLRLLSIDEVRDGVFFIPSSADACGRPAAVVVSELPERAILARLAEQIDAAFLPRPLYKVAQLPRNDTGKLTRAALDDLWRQRRG